VDARAGEVDARAGEEDARAGEVVYQDTASTKIPRPYVDLVPCIGEAVEKLNPKPVTRTSVCDMLARLVASHSSPPSGIA
jgi:hypothetical protein